MKRSQFLLWLPTFLLWGQMSEKDGKIYDQVMMRLANDPDVKGGGLDVDVKDGAVTVKGRVTTEKARLKIDRLVKRVKGVTQVVNQVRVEPQ
jgi:osmotically-inducible protein OsmY